MKTSKTLNAYVVTIHTDAVDNIRRNLLWLLRKYFKNAGISNQFTFAYIDLAIYIEYIEILSPKMFIKINDLKEIIRITKDLINWAEESKALSLTENAALIKLSDSIFEIESDIKSINKEQTGQIHQSS